MHIGYTLNRRNKNLFVLKGQESRFAQEEGQLRRFPHKGKQMFLQNTFFFILGGERETWRPLDETLLTVLGIWVLCFMVLCANICCEKCNAWIGRCLFLFTDHWWGPPVSIFYEFVSLHFTHQFPGPTRAYTECTVSKGISLETTILLWKKKLQTTAEQKRNTGKKMPVHVN